MYERFGQMEAPNAAPVIVECEHKMVIALDNPYKISERMCLDCLVVDFVCCDMSCVQITANKVTCSECGSNYVH